MMLGFLTFTLAPWLLRWEQELSSKLFTQEEIAAGFYIKHNVNALLRGDAATRSAFYTAALSGQTGWMSRDEVRALEDMNPDGFTNSTESVSRSLQIPEQEQIEIPS
jgi:HK97 family phage portal protein